MLFRTFLLAVVLAASAGAETIDFETFGDGTPAFPSVITPWEYATRGVVIHDSFVPPFPPDLFFLSAADAGDPLSSGNGVRVPATLPGPMFFELSFSPLVTSLAATFSVAFHADLFVRAFDDADQPVLDAVVAPSVDFVNEPGATVSAGSFDFAFGAEVRRVVLTTERSAIYLDNLRFAQVPEPGTLALATLGLAGIASRRRRPDR